MNTALGDHLGSLSFNGVKAISVQGKRVAIRLDISREIRTALFDRSKARLRQALSFGDAADVRAHYVAIHRAAVAGTLPSRGSVMPYLHFAFEGARRRSGPEGDDGGGGKDAVTEARSALLALGIYCGVSRLEILAGKVVPENLARQTKRCGGTTLGGRGDLRQHFIVSAVLEVMSNVGMAFTVGEFKELLDANKGGSGFSFDDIAADLAGIRFAGTLFAEKTAGTVPTRLLGMMDREDQIFPKVRDLPSGMTARVFKRRFGAVDSPAYKEMIASIQKRIDALPFHAGT